MSELRCRMNNTNLIMEQGKFYKQAEEIAAKFNFDRVIYAGVENGYEYYRLRRNNMPRYTGRPSVIKFSKDGVFKDVEDTAEIGRALSRIRRLYKSS